ncbi:probable DNA double-strand break repair Rad50 ATPase [Tribolium madens]|uniref:probable DNA double-strand break repair Rad50 ATPase n=1 Tax=Tribolium madens TaxID=41895 RepID=UPI001CF7399D|nr:probable DNA double-strand break repair Rad50 ATPase [Tribolium madens]
MSRDESFVAVKNTAESTVPSIGSDDEDSFVVLETSNSISESLACSPPRDEILAPIRTNKVHEMENLIKMKISQINVDPLPELPAAVDAIVPSVANIAISPDSSYEEIQKQVEELIKENEKLKNIIAQNNISMKTQYTRFLAYKDEVTNVMKSYKDKFNEAKMCIDKCKEENTKLVSDVEVYINLKKLHEEEILNLKLKIKELESLTNGPNLQLVDTGKVAMMKELELKQEEIERLTQKLEKVPKYEEELQIKQQQIDDFKLDVLAAKNRESDLIDEIQSLKITTTHLQSKLDNVPKEKEKLVQSATFVQTYEQLLKLKETEILKLKEEQQRTAFVESTLSDEIKNLKSQLKELQDKYNPRLSEDYIHSRAQLSVAQRTITALEQEREQKIKEMEDMRKLLQDNASANDEMFALKEQIEQYKNDFEAEKKSKLAMKQEKDQIAEDLQNLQTRNKQLQNEVERLRARNEPPRAEGYQCPKCSFGFSNYQSLENHVHRCLDLDGFP